MSWLRSMRSLQRCLRPCSLKPQLPSTCRRLFHDEFSTPDKQKENKSKSIEKQADFVPGVVADKYNVFLDRNATIIFDVEEERARIDSETEVIDTKPNTYAGITLQRGKNGVFEIEDLVALLRRDNGGDIFVCAVPPTLKYVDYICVVTGRSYRHMSALAQFVRKVYKIKRHSTDILPRIEGEESREWMALDLGNIALHIFSSETRKKFDLESLWSVGPEFDKESVRPEEKLLEIFERHSIYLGEFTPKNE